MAELKIYTEYSREEVKFNTNTLNSQLDELIKLQKKFWDNECKYDKALDRLTISRIISETLAVASSMAATATIVVNFRNSIGLSGICLSSSVSRAIIVASIKRYRNKLNKVMKSCHVVTSAIDVFERTLSRQPSDNISRMEFQSLCGIYYEALEKISKIDGE